LHLWISEIKSSKIRDGLHIFGQTPTGERYKNLLRLLVGVKNGDVPSLRMALAGVNSLDLEELLLNPGILNSDGRSNAQVLDSLDEEGREIFDILEQADYSIKAIPTALERYPEASRESKAVLGNTVTYVLEQLKPRLDATDEEMSSFSVALRGGFAKPGPSGAPSRGNADILPTGRNFYMVDPTAIPSRASWETGQRLARDLLARHAAAHDGEIPEGVSIVVYCGETITTGGDDIAEIMYLYGVRPLWVGSTNRVYSLEAIPIEELGRPRIDVTLRISGLFRDAFPNLIERIEDAVNLVASLDEPESQNFVKKHVNEEVAELVAQGMQVGEAVRLSGMRVFGCPPGTYGAGVDILVTSKQWETGEDLGRAYVNYSSHAYGRAYHGEKLPETFMKRMAKTQVTVKNISSDELDMLSDDDFYNYHGGLIAAARLAGANPDSYSTSAADVEHVKTRTIHEDTSRIMRMRIQNPKWIEGLKQHGFRGATEFAAMVDIVFGWDATTGVVDDWMYEEIAKTYLLDDELREWIRSVNPWALHAMSERLLEAASRGMWNADADTLEAIREIYLEMDGVMEGV
jgi:cobaltochelatase CobN